MSEQLYILKQELTISDIPMENSLNNFNINIPTDIMADVLLVLSCRTMDGMAKMNPCLLELIGMRHTDIDMNLIIDLNDTGSTFDEIAEYLDKAGLIQNSVSELTL
jgi:hypothetical protein